MDRGNDIRRGKRIRHKVHFCECPGGKQPSAFRTFSFRLTDRSLDNVHQRHAQLAPETVYKAMRRITGNRQKPRPPTNKKFQLMAQTGRWVLSPAPKSPANDREWRVRTTSRCADVLDRSRRGNLPQEVSEIPPPPRSAHSSKNSQCFSGLKIILTPPNNFSDVSGPVSVSGHRF